MPRLYYDASKYFAAKAALPAPDGQHCIICHADLPPKRRKYCSDGCFQKWYKTIEIKDWSKVRTQVKKRDHYTCQHCGITRKELEQKYCWDDIRGRLEVHHIIPVSKGGAEFDPGNGITLCHDCHRAVTIGKSTVLSIYTRIPAPHLRIELL